MYVTISMISQEYLVADMVWALEKGKGVHGDCEVPGLKNWTNGDILYGIGSSRIREESKNVGSMKTMRHLRRNMCHNLTVGKRLCLDKPLNFL